MSPDHIPQAEAQNDPRAFAPDHLLYAIRSRTQETLGRQVIAPLKTQKCPNP
jgi:hypothetical protein